MTKLKYIKIIAISFILNITFYCQEAWGQLSGHIKDNEGNPLSYATVYNENSSSGTVSNIDGAYFLDLPVLGKYTITFQYVGYKKEQFSFNYEGKPIQKNIILHPDDNILGELIISADREDPAYPIMRKAISKRSYYKTLVKSLEADLYVKGVVKINDAPQKILGEEIGNMNGTLDSTRQGLVYLSESKSKFYFQYPDKIKEIMISTVKSGDNSLFTANQFSWASFDLYDEYLKFGRTIVSPLADNALSHYKFKLEKTSIDKDGTMIHKIKIIPKSSTSPLLNGYIYIADEDWNIYTTELQLYGNVLKNTFLDTIQVRQVYVPVGDKQNRKLLSQVFSFKAGLLGFKMSGNFTYVFSNYQLNKDVSAILNSNETFKVEANALKKDSVFWKRERPVPLTNEEQRDYIKKDSLQVLWNSKSYMDSIDKIQNKFTIFKALTGFSFDHSYKKTSLDIASPIAWTQFNAVEGFRTRLNATWEKSDSFFRFWRVVPSIDYGFSDKKFKPRLHLEYLFDNFSLGKISITGGKEYKQFDTRKPINEINNTWTSLITKINKIRLYERDFVDVNYEQEISNGIYLDVNTSYNNRNPLKVNTHYSFSRKNCLFEENIPNPDLPSSYYEHNQYWISTIGLMIRPAQKFSSYPYLKIRDVSNWPNITTIYEYGHSISKGDKSYHKLVVKVKDSYVNAHLLGYFSYNLEGGSFLGNGPSYFADFFHPLGNEISSPIINELSTFNLMPYYEFSTGSRYAQINFRHHFNGYITDKIPLINKTPLKLVVGFSALYQPEKGEYYEPFIGLENFRIGPIQLFDIDYTWAFDKYGFRNRGITFRLSQMLNTLSN